MMEDFVRRRLLAMKGDPFLFANWERVVFLHFAIAPEVLRRQVPAPFGLELHEGRGVISLVALTKTRFRPAQWFPFGWPFRLLHDQRFLNLRTYVRWGDEPGAFFLWGWLSKPFRAPMPSAALGFPCAFVSSAYRHQYETGMIAAEIGGNGRAGRLAYHANIPAPVRLEPCRPGSLAEFTLERYTGFFCRRGEPCLFRAWHPFWKQTALEISLSDRSLVSAKFPWFDQAKLVSANFSPGFERVWLGRAHRLAQVRPSTPARRGRLSAFYQMP